MSSKIKSPVVLLGCVVELALLASLGCGSPAPSTQSSSAPAYGESPNSPAMSESAPNGSGNAADPGVESPDGTGQPSPARDGVDEATELQNPPVTNQAPSGTEDARSRRAVRGSRRLYAGGATRCGP